MFMFCSGADVMFLMSAFIIRYLIIIIIIIRIYLFADRHLNMYNEWIGQHCTFVSLQMHALIITCCCDCVYTIIIGDWA